MAQRRFGPVLGAGTAVVEKESQKQIVPGSLGNIGYIGILEKGPVGELIGCLKRGDFDNKCGGRIDESLVPDAAQDFWSLGDGAGELWCIRVTDGEEQDASATFWTRHDDAHTGSGTFFNGAVASLKVEGKSAGMWAGGAFRHEQSVLVADVTATTIDLDLALTPIPVDIMIDAEIYVEEPYGAGRAGPYKVTGNTAAGLVSVESHNDMAADWPTSGANPSIVIIERGNVDRKGDPRHVSVMFGDGVENPLTEFSMTVYVNGNEVRTYENLSMDPSSGRYVENVVNNDTGNHWVEVTNQWTGGVTALARPTNCWRGESSALTDPSDADPDLLTAIVTAVTLGGTNVGNGTGSVTAYSSDYLEDSLVFTCTTLGGAGVGKFKCVSTIYGTSANDAVTDGTAFSTGDRGVSVTLVSGATPWAVGDIVTIKVYRLAKNDALVGGYLWPDADGNPNDSYRIIENTGHTIRVSVGSDLTSVATIGDTFKVQAPQQLIEGWDGFGGLKANLNPWLVALDPVTCPWNGLRGQGKGLVKLASPGIAWWGEEHTLLSELVEKAGEDYAESRGYQWHVEVPPSTTDEINADAYVNGTVGKNDFAVTMMPGYCYVLDPDSTDGALKLVSMVGMKHGREAGVARDYKGYHKAAAGIEVSLPRVVKLTTDGQTLNEEYLNPRGLNVVKKVGGNYVIWGDRTIAQDPTWKWKHQREQMSHYELSLMESFDWIIWAINDQATWQLALTALYSFFLPEYRKRALQGDTFEEAARIKVDGDINDAAERAAGNLNAQVTLWLADTVERFVIMMGKRGIFEEVAA